MGVKAAVKDPMAIDPELARERRRLLGMEIKDAFRQHRNSRSLADAVLLITERYGEEEKELKLEAFKNHLASSPKPRPKERWSPPQFKVLP